VGDVRDVPDCRKRHEALVLDWTARTKAAQLWLEAGFGKPPTQPPALAIPSTGKRVEKMTDTELEAIIAAGPGDPESQCGER
jgi:hypothetical protein